MYRSVGLESNEGSDDWSSDEGSDEGSDEENDDEADDSDTGAVQDRGIDIEIGKSQYMCWRWRIFVLFGAKG